jgi:hypothetical protein
MLDGQVRSDYAESMTLSRPPSKAVREYLASLGRKGAKARAARLTADERQAIARKAANTRWAAKKGERLK